MDALGLEHRQPPARRASPAKHPVGAVVVEPVARRRSCRHPCPQAAASPRSRVPGRSRRSRPGRSRRTSRWPSTKAHRPPRPPPGAPGPHTTRTGPDHPARRGYRPTPPRTACPYGTRRSHDQPCGLPPSGETPMAGARSTVRTVTRRQGRPGPNGCGTEVPEGDAAAQSSRSSWRRPARRCGPRCIRRPAREKDGERRVIEHGDVRIEIINEGDDKGEGLVRTC